MRTRGIASTLIATVAAAMLLTSCSESGGSAGAAPEPPPKVSAATSCGQLFDGDAPVEGVVDLMQKPTTTPGDADVARTFADDLEPIGAQADDDLAPHVSVVVDELREFADTVDEREAYDTADMVTSLTELNNICGVTPRF